MSRREFRSEAFPLLRIISRALEPEVRRVIVETVHNHVQSDDPVFLANWLRHQFMTWLPNVPVCECGSVMSTSVYNFESETAWVADPSRWTGFRPIPGPDTVCSKVERYVCPSCRRVRLASRENDPLVLLRTRSGRCGEMAILYTCILLALGHDARLLVTRESDHVWAEVRIGGGWVPIDVSAEDVSRLIRDRYLFQVWRWPLKDLQAIQPGKTPVLVGESYRRPV